MGNEVTIPLFPAPITVYPDPRLSVKYFHQRDVFGDDPFTRDIVEPSVPFNLAVLVQNNGRGTARDVRIVSGQPHIVENEKGLLIDFQIIGTEVSGQAQSPSLTATFGEIPPEHECDRPLAHDQHSARTLHQVQSDVRTQGQSRQNQSLADRRREHPRDDPTRPSARRTR